MKNKIASLASLVLMLALFIIAGWYWNKAAVTQPNFNLCPLCEK